jgi:hypothetical protein
MFNTPCKQQNNLLDQPTQVIKNNIPFDLVQDKEKMPPN